MPQQEEQEEQESQIVLNLEDEQESQVTSDPEDEQESQIIRDLTDKYPFPLKPQNLNRSQHSGNDINFRQGNHGDLSSLFESFGSRVEETQYMTLEIDTQVQDSLKSRIEETQFVDLELDTQADAQILLHPIASQRVDNVGVGLSESPQTPLCNDGMPFFSRPAIPEDSEQFSFSTPAVRQSQFQASKNLSSIAFQPQSLKAPTTTTKKLSIPHFSALTSKQMNLESQDLARSSEPLGISVHPPHESTSSYCDTSSKERLGMNQHVGEEHCYSGSTDQAKVSTNPQDSSLQGEKDFIQSHDIPAGQHQSRIESGDSYNQVGHKIVEQPNISTISRTPAIFQKDRVDERKFGADVTSTISQHHLLTQNTPILSTTTSQSGLKDVTSLNITHATYETFGEEFFIGHATENQLSSRHKEQSVQKSSSRSRRIKQPFPDTVRTPSRRLHPAIPVNDALHQQLLKPLANSTSEVLQVETASDSDHTRANITEKENSIPSFTANSPQIPSHSQDTSKIFTDHPDNLNSHGLHAQDRVVIDTVSSTPNHRSEIESSLHHSPCLKGVPDDRLPQPQVLSLNPLQPPPHLESRRSSLGKSVTRSLQSKSLNPQGVNEASVLGPNTTTKVRKLEPKSAKSELTTFQKIVGFGEEYAAQERTCQEQLAFIEKQESELQQLKEIDAESKEKIKSLELDKLVLRGKLQKLSDLSTKYRSHANEIIRTQRYLKQEGINIHRRAEECRHHTESGLGELRQNIDSAVEGTQGFLERLAAAKKDMVDIVKTNKDLTELNQKLESEKEAFQSLVSGLQSANEHLVSSRVEFEAVEKERYQKLQLEAKKVDDINKQLLTDNRKILGDLMAALRRKASLEETINDRLIELSTEKHNVETLRKEIEIRKSRQDELSKLLKKLPGDVASKFKEEEGLMSKILSAESVTHAKVDQATALINTLKGQEPEPPASLVKLIENLFARLEKTTAASNPAGSTHETPVTKLLENVKESIKQLLLDKEAEIRLNNTISELRQINDALAKDKSVGQSELQTALTELAKARRDLSTCRSDLDIRNNELAAAQALTGEDPELQARAQDLERKNDIIKSQLESSNQEISNLKEDLGSSKEAFNRQKLQLKELEKKLLDSLARIKTFNDDKERYIAEKDQENKLQCQELTKKAEHLKGTLKRKLDSEIKNLEQKNRDLEIELKSVKEQIQKHNSEDEVYRSSITKLQLELHAYKEQLAHQASQLQSLEEQDGASSCTDEISYKIQATRGEISELRTLLQSSKTEISQSIEISSRGYISLEESLHNLNSLQRDKEKVEAENMNLKEELKNLRESLARQTHVGHRHGEDRSFAHGTTTITVTTPLTTGSSSMQHQRQPPSSNWNDSLSGLGKNGNLLPNMIETPEEALRTTMRHRAPYNTTYTSNYTDKTQGGTTQALVFEVPESQNSGSRVRSTESTKYHYGSVSSYSIRSDSRPVLRPAPRRRSRLGFPDSLEGVNSSNATVQQLKKKNRQRTFEGQGASSRSSRATLISSEPPAREKALYPLAHVERSSSSLTDYDSMIETLPSMKSKEQLQAAYEKLRSRKHESHEDSSLELNRQYFNTEAYSDDNDEESPAKRVKVQAKKTLSKSEESQRRRVSQPRKSAMKKPAQFQDDDGDDNDTLFQNRAFTFENTASDRGTQSESTKLGGTEKDARQTLGPNVFKGVVNGKQVKSNDGLGSTKKKSVSIQYQTPSQRPLGSQPSPIMEVAKRNRKASSGSSTKLRTTTTRTTRTAKPRLGSVVPDSQEGLC